MAKVELLDLGIRPGPHPAGHNAEREIINASRTALPGDDLQDMIDELYADGGGVLHIAPGTHTVTAPLVLPRNPSLNDLKGVHLVGQGWAASKIVATGGGWAVGEATIQWEGRTARAFSQRISGVQITAPAVAGTHAIRYQPTARGTFAAEDAEALELTMQDVRILGNNSYHNSLIRLEGTVRRSVFERVYGDPELGDGTFHTILFYMDGEDYATYILNDMTGLMYGYVSMCSSSLLRGGRSQMFKGRMNQSVMANCFCDGGSLGPCYEFINSAGCRILNLSCEGREEVPAQYVFRNCQQNRVEQLAISTPHLNSGHGLYLENSSYNTFAGRPWTSEKPVYSAQTTGKLLYLDTDSHHNIFTQNFIVRVGAGGLADEYTNLGSNNDLTGLVAI